MHLYYYWKIKCCILCEYGLLSLHLCVNFGFKKDDLVWLTLLKRHHSITATLFLRRFVLVGNGEVKDVKRVKFQLCTFSTVTQWSIPCSWLTEPQCSNAIQTIPYPANQCFGLDSLNRYCSSFSVECFWELMFLNINLSFLFYFYL